MTLAQTTDVIVVGGGPAGLATAIELAQANIAVVVIERQSFPIDKPCGEGTMPSGVEHLQRLGILSRIHSAHLSPFMGLCLINQQGSKAFSSFPTGHGFGVRRVALSQAFFERASEFYNLKILSPNRVLGIKHDQDWISVVTEHGVVRGRIMIGADGLRSSVRKWANLECKTRSRQRYGIRKHFQIPPWNQCVEVHFAKGVEAYITPCGFAQTGVAFLWEKSHHACSLDEKPSFHNFLRCFPELEKRLADAKPISTELAIGPLEQKCLAPISHGIALVGDASGYLDAITGEGNSLALSQAHALAAVVMRALRTLPRGVIPKDALVPYAKAHRKIVRVYYRNTHLMLLLARRPRLMSKIINIAAKNRTIFSLALAKAQGSS